MVFFWFKGKNCRRNHFGRGFCQCLLLFFSSFFFLVVMGLMSVGVVGFVIIVVVVGVDVVVEVVIDIDGGGFDECGYGWICD